MKLTLPPMLNTNLEPADLGDQIASLWINLVLKDGRTISIPVMKHFDLAQELSFSTVPVFEPMEAEVKGTIWLLKSEKFIIEVDYGEGVVP